MARRPKYTPDLVDRLIDCIESGLTDADACAVAGIHQDTFYHWQNTKSEFSDRVQRARPAGWKADLDIILKAAKAGDWRAAAEHLDRTKSPYRKSTEITGAGGGPIMLDPGWSQLRSVIVAVLAPYPEALAQLAESFDALGAGDEQQIRD